jgi:hypothetical protein
LTFPFALKLRVARPALLLYALTAAACTTTPPSSSQGGALPAPYSAAEPGPANINLQGFPLEYRQGYADGCVSASGAERRDATRYASDGQYRTGWQDGNALCRKR